MAPLPVVTDAWQMVVHGTAPSSQSWENVFGIIAAGDLDQTEADGLASSVATLYGVLDGWSDAYSVDSITVTDLRVLDGPQFDSANDLPVAGRDSANPLPLQVAALISWGTSHRGRSYRGRTYIPGFTETFANGAHVITDALDSLGDFRDLIVAPGGHTFGVISRYEPNPSPPPSSVLRDPGMINEITDGTVHSLWKTQRRRAPRG